MLPIEVYCISICCDCGPYDAIYSSDYAWEKMWTTRRVLQGGLHHCGPQVESMRQARTAARGDARGSDYSYRMCEVWTTGRAHATGPDQS